MTGVCSRLEPAILAIVAAILFGAAFQPFHFYLLNALPPAGGWLQNAGNLEKFAAIFGLACALASAFSFVLNRYQRQTLIGTCVEIGHAFWNEIRVVPRWIVVRGQLGGTAAWLALALTVATSIRVYFLSQPMRYDEAYTFMTFVKNGFASHFYYPLPNNHVLHTVLVRGAVALFGSNPLAIRLPALIAGCLAIPLLFFLSRLLSQDRRSGYIAATLMSMCPYFILYDTMARGYSIMVLLTLILMVLGTRALAIQSAKVGPLMGLVTALGMLDMPSFLFPAASVFAWVAMVAWKMGRNSTRLAFDLMLPWTLATMAMTVIVYIPVLVVNNGLGDLFNNKFVASLPWLQFIARLPGHLLSTANDFVRDVPNIFLFGLIFALFIGIYVEIRKRNWIAAMLIPAMCLGGATVLIAKHVIPFERTWIFILPCFIIAIDTGLITLIKASERTLKVLSVVAAAGAALAIGNRDLISKYPDTGHFPEAPILIEFLASEMRPGDRVTVKIPADAPIRFYLWYLKVPRTGMIEHVESGNRTFVIVKPSVYELSDIAGNERTRLLLKTGDAEVYIIDNAID